MQVLIKRMRCASMSISVSRPALLPCGYETRSARRWSVENTPLPGGIGPSDGDVVAHFAALSDLSGLVPVEVPDMTAAALYDAGGRILPKGGDAAAYAVRDGNGGIWGVYADADGAPAMVEAHADEAQAAQWAAAVARECGVCAGADKAAQLWRDCVQKALADPAVMTPIFDAADTMAIERVRERFSRADYVEKARQAVRLLPAAK